MNSAVSIFFSVTLGIVGLTLWFMPRDARIARHRLWAGTFLTAFVALLGVTLVDWPIWPDAVPEPLWKAASGDPRAIDRFHSYYLGGFIDHDWLCGLMPSPRYWKASCQNLA